MKDLAAGGSRGVTIEGGGEPLQSPLFGGAAEGALESGLSLGLITNGLLLFSEAAPAGLLSRFQWIRVSLDASDEPQYKRLKGSAGFAKAMENIGRLAGLSPKPVVGVGYVLTRLNRDLEGLCALARSLKALGGVNYLSVRPVVDHPELEAGAPEAKAAKPGGFGGAGRAGNAGKAGGSGGAGGAGGAASESPPPQEWPPEPLKALEGADFKVDLAPLADNSPEGNLSLPCSAHSLTTVVGADGNVWLCGRLNASPDFPPMGNLMESPFPEIWAGAKRMAQASDAANPEFCRAHCPKCRMTKYNRLLTRAAALKTPDFI
jgi:radical SAM protein with 4Fe4S-binding SPASM domain